VQLPRRVQARRTRLEPSALDADANGLSRMPTDAKRMGRLRGLRCRDRRDFVVKIGETEFRFKQIRGVPKEVGERLNIAVDEFNVDAGPSAVPDLGGEGAYRIGAVEVEKPRERVGIMRRESRSRTNCKDDAGHGVRGARRRHGACLAGAQVCPQRFWFIWVISRQTFGDNKAARGRRESDPSPCLWEMRRPAEAGLWIGLTYLARLCRARRRQSLNADAALGRSVDTLLVEGGRTGVGVADLRARLVAGSGWLRRPAVVRPPSWSRAECCHDHDDACQGDAPFKHR